MADRRPLASPFATATDLDPDVVRNFVRQESPGAAPAPEPAAERPPAARAAPPPKTKKKRTSGIAPVAPIPVTVRLRPEIAGGLKRASLERQLAGEETFTQQDLVETLLEPWLREQGYID